MLTANDQFRLFIERLERLEEEKAGVAEDIKCVFSEMKSNGYDVKITREVLRLRKMSKDDLDNRNALLRLYGEQIGLDLI
jgi:uncharacterized protein (UPF0335 family)